MNSLKYIIALWSLAFLFHSCTEEIDIDLNSSDPQIVVEGTLNNLDNNAVVKLSKSVNFDQDNTFPPVEGATVMISDDEGNSFALSEDSPGVYTSQMVPVSIGETYYLNVLAEGKEFSAQSTMPTQAVFESLTIEESDFSFGQDETFYNLIVEYTDIANEENYYRFIEYLNGEYQASYVLDDRLYDGLTFSIDLLNFESEYNSGDTVTVAMQCIDKAVYDYFFSLELLEDDATPSPANPVTNIEGGKLGYFSAYTQELKQVIVP
jgi:hypothetical protein